MVQIYLDRSVCVGNSSIHPSSQNRKEGRSPAHQITEHLAHQITENLCAPFIHGFIVDKLRPRPQTQGGTDGAGVPVVAQTELCPVHRVLCDERAWQPITRRGTFAGGRTFVLPHPGCKRRSLDGAQSIEGGPEVKNLTGPPAHNKVGTGHPISRWTEIAKRNRRFFDSERLSGLRSE